MATARSRRLCLLLGLPLWTSALHAQATAAPSEQQGDAREAIVVTGRAEPSRGEVSRQAREIAKVPGNIRRHPLARFEKPVCPGVMGMPKELAEHMVGRIRHVAGQAGIELAPQLTCSVNLLVAFVPDSLEGIRQVERAWPAMFETLSLAERREIIEGPGPVRVVTMKTERTRDGFVIPSTRGSATPPVVTVPLAFSKIYLTTREDIEGVVLLMETKAIDGLSVVQVADYAAMRSFAETRPPSGDVLAMDTILTLFESGAAPPQSMTEFDEAYLRSLYDGLPNMPAITKTLGVNRQLGKMDDEQRRGE